MPLALRDYLAWLNMATKGRAPERPRRQGEHGTFSQVSDPGGDPGAQGVPGIGVVGSHPGSIAAGIAGLSAGLGAAPATGLGMLGAQAVAGLLSADPGLTAQGLSVAGVPGSLSFTDPQGITGPAVVTETLSGPLAGLLGPAPVGFADPATAAAALSEAVQGIDATPADVASMMAAISFSPAVGSVTAGLSPGQAASHGNEAGIPGQLGAFGHDDPGNPGAVPGAPGESGTSAGPSASGVGTGDAGAGDYHGGGVVRDRRPGMEEPITAQQGEFVVRRGPATKYRSLLEAINADDPARIRQRARSLKEAMTR